MKRFWLGIGVLAGSWLFGLSYVEPANYVLWSILVAVGILLLAGSFPLPESRWQMAAAAVCLLPAVWLLPWPYRAAPLLAAIGLVLQLPSLPVAWPKAVGRGALWAGIVLLAQAVLLELYQYHTARTHELPKILLWPLAALLRIAGVDAAASDATANGSAIVMRSIGGTHRLAATWELLLDPATFCFAVGGLVAVSLWILAALPRGKRWSAWLAAARRLTIVVVAWLPLRFVLFVALYLHRVLIDTSQNVPVAANQFVSAWPYVLMLAGPVLLAMRFVRLPSLQRDLGEVAKESPAEVAGGAGDHVSSPGFNGRAVAGLVLAAAAVAVFTVGVSWSPVGVRRQGRVKIVERHSTWEPTTRPYDTQWYGEYASYNYAAVYDYLSQYYEMSRLLEEQAIDDGALRDCDVLVIKIPTARFSRKEVGAICKFVEDGGALLLIGDHTNVFNCNTYLNDISRNFGFTFRNDLLFCVGSPYKQRYERPVVPHPAVQHVPWMNYAVSCSIDPGQSGGEMVMRATGLWNLPPDYNASNYHPQAEYRPDMQVGAFCQAWATTYGKGRVLAFTDSTLFSNFCTYQEGKVELLRSMVEYLNHSSLLDRFWLRRGLWLLVMLVAAGLLVVAAWFSYGEPMYWALPVAAGVLGWTLASGAVIVVHRTALPPPRLRDAAAQSALTHVVVDRELSEVPLSQGAFPQGDGEGYGLLEQWIPRLGNYTSRERKDAVFSGNALVVIEPTRSVSRHYRDELVEFVKSGGHVLIIDSPDNGRTTSNSLLWPFEMELSHAEARTGPLRMIDDWPGIELQPASRIKGGEPIAWVDDIPVAAQVQYGDGSITVFAFGYIFRDASMGIHWMPQPSEETKGLYRVLFTLLEAGIEGREPDEKWKEPSEPGPPSQTSPAES